MRIPSNLRKRPFGYATIFLRATSTLIGQILEVDFGGLVPNTDVDLALNEVSFGGENRSNVLHPRYIFADSGVGNLELFQLRLEGDADANSL